jgi:putative hydrolase
MPSPFTVVSKLSIVSVLVATVVLLVGRNTVLRGRVLERTDHGFVFPSAGSVGTMTPTAPMTPETALLRVIHCLDRAFESGFKTKAFVRALDVVRTTDSVELAERARDERLTELDGIGDSTAAVITEALAGIVPRYLTKIERESVVSITAEGAEYRAALTGDCHLHSRWSDGGAEIEAMAATAIDLGHEYMVLTDHSARLTVAHGLSEERLATQLDEIARINADIAAAGHEFRILTGMEVDILEDGSLDLADAMLARLDVVVASVHSKLRMDRQPMTERMLLAVANPHVDILGHCTGRMIGKRPPSQFDADYVFAACAQFGTAVEINCRPERLDPPRELLDLAIEYGCWFSIDSDAHSTGQLEWQPHGCDRAAEREVPIDRIVNAMPADDLLAWAAN